MSELKLGCQVFELIKKHGFVWGGSTTAIIAGLGLNLINQTLIKTGVQNDLIEQTEKLFNFCDDDETLFGISLHSNIDMCNQIPEEMLQLILEVLQNVKQYEHNVKKELLVDYVMGCDFLKTAAKATYRIMESNDFVGISQTVRDSYQHHLKRLETC